MDACGQAEMGDLAIGADLNAIHLTVIFFWLAIFEFLKRAECNSLLGYLVFY